MSLIKVYSRSPIGHKFSLVMNGVEVIHEIKGTNSHMIMTGGVDVPYITEMEDSVFNAIKEEYKNHIALFGGVYPKPERQIMYEPLIYTAKNDTEARKIMHGSKPIITENELGAKSKGIEKFKEKE